MDSSSGKGLTENPTEKHPFPETQSRGYDSKYPGARTSEWVLMEREHGPNVSLPSPCDDCTGNSSRTVSHDLPSDPTLAMPATHKEMDSGLYCWLYSEELSLLIHSTLCSALASHVPSAEMLFPQISTWLIPSLLESLLRCLISRNICPD